MNITIDPEFRDLIPPLAPAELENLHGSLSSEGCRDPLAIWKDRGILLDGHNRHSFCAANNVDYRTVEICCDDREAAKQWIILNQLGRRNLAPDAASVLRGTLYNSRKKDNHSRPDNQNAKRDGQNDTPVLSTAELVAKETGVSPSTVRRDARFAGAVEKLGKTQEAMSGQMRETRREVIEQAEATTKPPARAQPSRTPRFVPDDAERLWVIAQSHLDKILPTDKSREQVFREVIAYAEKRIADAK